MLTAQPQHESIWNSLNTPIVLGCCLIASLTIIVFVIFSLIATIVFYLVFLLLTAYSILPTVFYGLGLITTKTTNLSSFALMPCCSFALQTTREPLAASFSPLPVTKTPLPSIASRTTSEATECGPTPWPGSRQKSTALAFSES